MCSLYLLHPLHPLHSLYSLYLLDSLYLPQVPHLNSVLKGLRPVALRPPGETYSRRCHRRVRFGVSQVAKLTEKAGWCCHHQRHWYLRMGLQAHPHLYRRLHSGE